MPRSSKRFLPSGLSTEILYAFSLFPCSSWEANSHSASQKIPLLLWNLKVHYRLHKGQLLAHILSQINPVHTSHYLPKIHSNIIFPSTPRSSQVASSLQVFQPKYGMHFSSLPCMLHAPLISTSLICHPNNIWQRVQITELFIMYISPSCHFLYLRSKYSHHLVLRHPQCKFSQNERPSFAPIWKRR
jgi:hypothetical protein